MATTHHFKSPSSSDIQRSSESSVSHRGGTLTASSHHAPSGIDLGHAPSRTQTATNALTTAPTKPPRCILAGGMARGWTHESIIVCWRRFLGIMGNLNSIKTVSNLEKVYIYINELVDVLLKIQQNQALSPVSDNCVRPLPLYCTPLDPVLPVLLEALTLPEQPTSIQLSALRALTAALLRPPQGRINLEAIAQFYRLLHRFLSISDKPYVYEIIRSCGMLLFSSELPSCHLLILDFLHGASVIFDDPSPAREAPRIEALTMITTLLCYSTHFGSLDCLDQTDPESIRLIPCSDLRFRLLELLVRVTLNDPSADARCLALSALAIYCVIELVHSESNPASPLPLDGRSASFPIDALAVLLGMMRFSNRSIALVAVDAVRMLTGYFYAFSQLAPGLPLLIVRSLTWTLNYIWDSSYDSDIFQLDKRLLVIIILTITEWMLLLPLSSTRTASYGSGADVESECLLSTVLTTLYKVICTSPPCDSTSSETEQTTTALPVELPDPLVSLLSDCQIPIDLKAFSAPQSLLDSSLDVQSYTLTDAKHIWPEYEQLGETSRPQQSIRLAARVALSHMLNHLDHFPMDDQGAQLNTIIQEHHDHFTPRNTFNFDDTSELSLSVLEKDNIQLFAINKSILLSFISLPAVSIQQQASRHLYSGSSSLRQPIPLNESAKSGFYPLDIFLSHSPSSSSTSATNLWTAVSDAQYTRVIVRDFSGKYSWDLSVLHALSCNWHHSDNEGFMPDGTSCGKSDNVQDPILLRTLPPCPPPRSNPNPPPLTSNQASLAHSGSPAGDWSHCTPGAVPQVASPNHSSPLALKDSPNTTPDVLQTLLSDLAVSSPECYVDLESNFRDSLPSAVTDSSTIDSSSNMETLTGDQITAQCQMDADILLHNSKYSFSIEPIDREPASIKHPDWYVPPTPPTSPSDDSSQRDSPFDLAHFASCRHLINQLGLLSFECRPTIELIQKSAGLVRDLKHLDKFGVRESHKIAVFYVSAGQEDKQSILANQSASLEFENFVAGLGWEIDLVTHRGFRGGLEQSGRAGKSTPYYATATLEVIFHVSTRMPSSTQEDLKYKHLGNDDVMIIWTENARAFTRGVLRTQFGDVLIIISPLPSGLFRVEVQRKTGVGLFGPIVHLAVLDFKTLPGLVRATAISASRAVRAMKPGYGAHYEERAASLRQIIHRHIAYTCFEDFVQSLILPSVPIDCIPAPSGLNGLNAPRESTDNVRMPPSHFPSQWNPSMPVATTIQQPTVSSQTSVTAGARPGNVTKEKK
ncbi:unnamed protein product [Dicrocoelium dendriticum]|nr:unnamed protein product [Dicrocoelium dendriticum]CAH8446120.1 unnamed protein product [Dicrocoelium dendriticum]